LVPGRGGGGGQFRRVLAIFGRNGVVTFLESLASSGVKVGRSLAKVSGHRRFQVSSLPIGAPEMLAAKLEERKKESKKEVKERKGRERKK